MMKILFSLLMMIPLSFFGGFWFNQFVWLLLSFIFLLSFSSMNMFSMLSGELGVDLLSYVLILLSFWICSLMLMASEKIYLKNNWYGVFLFVVLSLMISLYFTFSALNVFVFYIFFEISLIPTLILIMGWGYQPERLQAGVYMLFYTLLASLPMMISLFFCYNYFDSLHYFFLSGNIDSLLIYLLINFVFFIKIPMFFVHLWLPKAHVEAPVSGSMILAGIMLKLGGYGMMRLMVIFTLLGMQVNIFFISISLVGGFYVSLICLRQSDMKSLIAYSSVSHMGLVLAGVMTLNYWGLSGSLAMMVAHGLCSSGLFCLANISYERLMSRSLYINKGLINLMPSLSLMWFLLVSSNMAAPPSLNLLGEIMLINSILSFSSLNMFFLMLISFFSAVYSLFLYSYSQHGFYYSGYYSFFSCSVREYLLLMMHWLPLNLLILSGDYLSLWI
uniref:NADH-ubiquinone oxidoreductase chain 4 n=1 Tax=Gonocephalum sp. MT-2015-Zz052324 TaxID=1874194 RepID=A0A7R5XV45_9CUCU|nr:NADH dehydrogenase subunit 4 [Gonocephalum sp. MT-2015-Zz052324]ANT72392.1 NADH dehydrogenase subunit 4 [Gonocephalum sp. MT-2015-Zz052324]